nr:hypothetical protein GCM10020093_083130 [Planobispora longispora]
MFLPAGLLVGLILGIMAAVLADRSDKQVRAATDLRRVLGVETLLDLPSNPKTVTLGLESARGRVGQRFHELSHGITARLGGGPANQVVLVTGAAEGRGPPSWPPTSPPRSPGPAPTSCWSTRISGRR